MQFLMCGMVIESAQECVSMFFAMVSNVNILVKYGKLIFIYLMALYYVDVKVSAFY